jgi:hypothetical protein
VTPLDLAADALNAAESAGARMVITDGLLTLTGEPEARTGAMAALTDHPDALALLAMRSELAEHYRAAAAPEPVLLASGRTWDEAVEWARMEARQILRDRRAAGELAVA